MKSHMISNYRYQDIKYLLTKKIWLTLNGKMKHNLVKVFYVKWSNNFGDLLTPLILNHYGLTTVFAYPKKAGATCVGTILSIVKGDFTGHILGSGWSHFGYQQFPHATIWGVRGKLSKQYLRISNNVTIGDPGLLCSHLFPIDTKNKKFRLGLIPHESEINDIRIARIREKYPDHIQIITPTSPNPIKVIEQICSCENIISSSLHGLIIADSYGIPSFRMKLNELDDSGDFKFHDYYSSLGEELSTHQMTGDESLENLCSLCRKSIPETIAEIQKNLNSMFTLFAKNIKI